MANVFVGLSGGVDSAVSAYLLQEQGHQVTAVFMKNWTGSSSNLAGECNWVRERDDAQAVAERLNIPFEVWDFEREYRARVVEHFFREYARGRTPNPDIRCNQFVKIPLFLKRARERGADLIATGHYARNVKWKNQNGKFEYRLLAGVDESKDQSYFLYTLKQSQLKHLLFPVGDIAKTEVRAIAKRAKLPVAEKPDSVGICFVGEVRINEFLRTRIPERPGLIVTTKGKAIGTHRGLAFYTVGQRQGIGLSNGPWYVVGRNWRKNQLIVGALTEQKLIMAKRCTVTSVHWIGTAPGLPARLYVRHRYRHPVFPAILSKRSGRHVVTFSSPQRAITPGQAAVFYRRSTRGLECLGGGTIAQVEKKIFQW